MLRRLPSAVLSRQGYLRLIELLDDSLCAKALHHLEQREITDSIVCILYEAPAVLRPVLAELLRVIESTEKLDHLQDGLRWLATRGAAESFDALVTDLAAHVQPGQFVSPEEAGFGIAVAANLAAKKDRDGTTDRRNSGYLRGRQAVQELSGKLRDRGRCWGIRDLPVGRSG